MPKPNVKPRWATFAIPNLEIIEPPENKKDIGWLSQEKPPYQFMNWLFKTLADWIDYVEEIGDGIQEPVKAMLPVGSVFGFLDFDGVNQFDPEVFHYLDGSIINDPQSPMNGLQLEDASGRYLVGFGKDGGKDLSTAPFSINPVGNAGHSVNLQHSHVQGNHTHGAGTLKFKTLVGGAASDIWGFDINGDAKKVAVVSAKVQDNGQWDALRRAGPDLNVGQYSYTTDGIGTTAAGGAVNTANALSTTQSIQPCSVPVRWIIRYK